MPRKLTATTGVLLVLAFAGCGKDDKSATSASSAAPTTAPATTTTAGAKAPTSKTKASTKKSSAAKKSSATKATAKTTTTSKATDAQTTTTKEPAKQTATTKKKQKSTTTTATTKNPVSVTPAPGAGAGAGADPSSGTGSGSKEERLAVVAVLRRYYKAFSDRDGATACSLLTDQGKGIMKADGGAKTCAASVVKLVQLAGSKNVALLETTRDGLHVDDITITGNNATAQIGKISRLRLVQQDGRWLLRSPNVVNGSG